MQGIHVTVHVHVRTLVQLLLEEANTHSGTVRYEVKGLTYAYALDQKKICSHAKFQVWRYMQKEKQSCFCMRTIVAEE